MKDEVASRIAQLQEEINRLKAQDLSDRKARLALLYKGMLREDMQLLRDLLNAAIAATYDGDDE